MEYKISRGDPIFPHKTATAGTQRITLIRSRRDLISTEFTF